MLGIYAKFFFFSFRMNRRERDDERRQWADMVASATANFNILSARNGQELVNARIDVEDVLAGLKGDEDISREKRDALHGLLEASVTKMQCVIKSLYVHIQYGAGVALELRQASTSYLSEDESRLAKKMKKEFEDKVGKKTSNEKDAGKAGNWSTLQKAKEHSFCHRCNMRGHWSRDASCPLNLVLQVPSSYPAYQTYHSTNQPHQHQQPNYSLPALQHKKN